MIPTGNTHIEWDKLSLPCGLRGRRVTGRRWKKKTPPPVAPPPRGLSNTSLSAAFIFRQPGRSTMLANPQQPANSFAWRTVLVVAKPFQP